MSIFLSALEKDVQDERAAFLQQVCEEPGLRAEVEELLEAHGRPDNLLDEVPIVVQAARETLAEDDLGNPGQTPTPVSGGRVAERPGTMIGPYKLMEQIGEGGVGLVFVASQQRPIRRLVALKLIKPGMDTWEVIGRFEAERQAIALMDHPNIARVFDAGATDSGRPYFVMELVRGNSITEFCDLHQLSTIKRLSLFIDVCQAVQHAHQKGIIHRDLKPSNVLVTLHDGRPLVKVIDFGVAKAIGWKLAEQTIYTGIVQMIGTPLYMSPEQAELSGLDVDTRSDIYSLGVLLYELLTGSTPLDRERMRTAAFDEVRRIVREEDPPTPSTKLTRLRENLSAVSAKQKSLPAELLSLVRGDLDWVVMKAIDKQPSRRYETVAALASDVRHFLRNEPVEARSPTARYRFLKFRQRHRLAVISAMLIAGTLLLGTGVSTWQAICASEARADADRLRRNAEDFAEHLKAANVLLASGRDHADQSQWASAYVDYSKAAELQPNHYLVWSGRGSLYLRFGLWRLAAGDYAKAQDLGATATDPGWVGVPQLFFYCGDEKRYRDACLQFIARLDRTPNAFYRLQMIRSIIVAPVSGIGPDELARQCEGLMEIRSPARRPDEPRAFPLYVTGLAHYRAGQYEDALHRLDQAMTAEPRWPSRALIYPVLAMTDHRLGKASDARSALQSAETGIDDLMDQATRHPLGNTPIPWIDWVECLALYREAQAVINGHTPYDDDARFRVIEARALSVLKPKQN